MRPLLLLLVLVAVAVRSQPPPSQSAALQPTAAPASPAPAPAPVPLGAAGGGAAPVASVAGSAAAAVASASAADDDDGLDGYEDSVINDFDAVPGAADAPASVEPALTPEKKAALSQKLQAAAAMTDADKLAAIDQRNQAIKLKMQQLNKPLRYVDAAPDNEKGGDASKVPAGNSQQSAQQKDQQAQPQPSGDQQKPPVGTPAGDYNGGSQYMNLAAGGKPTTAPATAAATPAAPAAPVALVQMVSKISRQVALSSSSSSGAEYAMLSGCSTYEAEACHAHVWQRAPCNSAVTPALMYEAGRTIHLSKWIYDVPAPAAGPVTPALPLLADAQVLQSFPGTDSGISGFHYNGPCAIIASATQRAVYVVFRGTDSVQDVLSDAGGLNAIGAIEAVEFRINNVNYGNIHMGFAALWLNRPDIHRAVKAAVAARPGFKVIFTGHSLGGAMAQIYATEYAIRYGGSNVHVYTFGSPRVGDATFRRQITRRTFHARFKDNDDIVPNVPIHGVKGAVPVPFWYGHGYDVYVRLLDHATPTIVCPTVSDGSTSFADHASARYQARISRAIWGEATQAVAR